MVAMVALMKCDERAINTPSWKFYCSNGVLIYYKFDYDSDTDSLEKLKLFMESSVEIAPALGQGHVRFNLFNG
jgi:hypothetical protein